MLQTMLALDGGPLIALAGTIVTALVGGAGVWLAVLRPRKGTKVHAETEAILTESEASAAKVLTDIAVAMVAPLERQIAQMSKAVENANTKADGLSREMQGMRRQMGDLNHNVEELAVLAAALYDQLLKHNLIPAREIPETYDPLLKLRGYGHLVDRRRRPREDPQQPTTTTEEHP